MAWWQWLLLGLGLLVVEMLTPGGFVALFFGVSALLLAAFVGSGAISEPWIQWTVFAGISALSVLVLRRPLLANLGTKEHLVDTWVGEPATVLMDIEPGGVGKCEFRGSSWTARSTGEDWLVKGDRCIVERIEDLTLWVRRE
jgi:membrane protein implicated in regulation of membrane protease activity